MTCLRIVLTSCRSLKLLKIVFTIDNKLIDLLIEIVTQLTHQQIEQELKQCKAEPRRVNVCSWLIVRVGVVLRRTVVGCDPVESMFVVG